MDKSRPLLFITGLLVLASAGTSALFYSRYKALEADRATDAERIAELTGQLELAQAEVADYRDKLREARDIAQELERERDTQQRQALEYASRIEQLEAEIEVVETPERPEEPVAVALIANEPLQPPDEALDTAGVEEGGPAHAAADAAADAGAEKPPTAAAVAESADLGKELEEVRAEKRDLEQKYAALVGDKAEGVPLGEVKVTTGLKLKGKVLVVNRRHSFVVVDLGARDGVETGMVLILHRDKKFIGKCQVAKVYNAMAAADLVLDWMQDEVQVNDGVRKF
jgi:TolA-binding protein